METQCLKIKIKPGMTEKLIEYLKGLDPAEVNEVLKLETMVVETLFLERADSSDYLLMYAKAENQRPRKNLWKKV